MNAEREYNGILFKTCPLIFLTEPKMQFSFFQYKREKNFTLLLYSFLEISMQIVSLFLITRHFMAFQISKICKCTWYFLSPPSIPTIQPYISCHEAPETAVKVKGWLDWGLEGIPWRCGRSAAVEPNSFCRWTESLKIPCSNPPLSDLIRFASSILAPRPPVSLCLVQRASHAQ